MGIATRIVTDNYFLSAVAYERLNMIDSAIKYYQISLDSVERNSKSGQLFDNLIKERLVNLSRCYSVLNDTINARQFINRYSETVNDTGIISTLTKAWWNIRIDFSNHNYSSTVKGLKELLVINRATYNLFQFGCHLFEIAYT
jgi:hypothetical protein